MVTPAQLGDPGPVVLADHARTAQVAREKMTAEGPWHRWRTDRSIVVTIGSQEIRVRYGA